MAYTATLNPSNIGLGGQGGISSEDNIVFTYKMAASASCSKGDFLKLTSSALGTVEKCTATGDAMIGVSAVSVDNSSGAAGDLFVPVIVQGIVEVDGVVAASGNMAATIFHNSPLYLTHAVTGVAGAGQALTATNSGSALIGVALDAVTAVPTASALYRMRVFIDRLNDIVN